jgi:hypothetical protein
MTQGLFHYSRVVPSSISTYRLWSPQMGERHASSSPQELSRLLKTISKASITVSSLLSI